MIFGREREAVRNATRAIRDLVLRRELGGAGGIGGGLGAMAMMAVGAACDSSPRSRRAFRARCAISASG